MAGITFVFQAIAVFAAVAALDFVWAKYTYAITTKRATLAGFYGAVVFLLSGVATLGYVASPWLLLPAVAGAFVGTYAAVR